MDNRTQKMVDFFQKLYGSAPQKAVQAPGRVNIIGEHTDYNDGFCLPMAIERDVRIAVSATESASISVASCEKQESGAVTFDLCADVTKDPDHAWVDYVKGCVVVLLAEGIPVRGCQMVITGNVPLGSGLSSSAALEVAVIHALLCAAEHHMPAERIAVLAQRAENSYVGTNCGILDQLSSSCGMDGSAMLMDCRSLALTPAPLPKDVCIVIADTGKRRGLVDSLYNERRAQCEAGAAALSVSHLRDVSMHGLAAAHAKGELDADALRRCEHVVAENGRTFAAAACLRAEDSVALGYLMDQSHTDLRDKFEVSCPELDAMVTFARTLPGCLGSRMTGAGFGGCTVSLVQRSEADAFVQKLAQAYQAAYPAMPVDVFITGAAPGAGLLDLSA